MKQIITFNHISKTLTNERQQELQQLYHFYHKQAICYRWLYKLALDLTAAALVAVGGIAGVTLNPIVIGTLSGTGVLIGTYTNKSRLTHNVEMSVLSSTHH